VGDCFASISQIAQIKSDIKGSFRSRVNSLCGVNRLKCQENMQDLERPLKVTSGIISIFFTFFLITTATVARQMSLKDIITK
jgi:hypothetical protein